MNNAEEKFIIPVIEIIDISREDVIATSGIMGDDDGKGDSLIFGEEE